MSPLPPETIPKKRFLGFLIWQSIPSTLLFFLLKTIFSIFAIRTTASAPRASSVLGFLVSFISFELSQLLFSASLSTLSSPRLDRPASPLELGSGLVRLVIGSQPPVLPELRQRAELSLSIASFVAACAVSGFVAVAAMCWVVSGGGFSVRVVGFRGFAVGLFYGLSYVYKQRWVLRFPIVQRPLFFSFKMGVPSAVRDALKFSAVAYISSAVVLRFVQLPFRIEMPMETNILECVFFYVGSFAVFLCWELSHHLHQVLHAKRCMFAPPRGSAAAETNPSEPLLAALEESSPGSLVQYLGYLDLCMVCENNVDTWRRAAFFEETGETYKRVIAVCLRPLELLAAKLGEGLETSSVDKSYQQSSQLLSPNDMQLELLNNYQLCAWCARTIACLTTRSHTEDRFGVAQLSGSNAAVVSTLLSCLLAVESFLGKKTHLQSSNQFMGPGGIRWAAPNTGRREFPSTVVGKKRGSPLHAKAYAIADILRVSVYQVVSAFHDEMQSGAKSGLLERDWISSTKPPFGTRDLLVQKLRLFLEFRAS